MSNVDWDVEVFNFIDIDKIYLNFINIFKIIVDKYVFKKIVIIRLWDKVFMNSIIRVLMRKCNCIYYKVVKI